MKDKDESMKKKKSNHHYVNEFHIMFTAWLLEVIFYKYQYHVD